MVFTFKRVLISVFDVCVAFFGGGSFGKFAQNGGHTALIWAGFNGHADCLRLLLDAGADKEVTDWVRVSQTCLCTA